MGVAHRAGHRAHGGGQVTAHFLKSQENQLKKPLVNYTLSQQCYYKNVVKIFTATVNQCNNVDVKWI